jgi:hypothetical protein
MKYFQNSANADVYAFDDDVKVTVADGVYSFMAPDGTALDQLPATLQPGAAPPPPPAPGKPQSITATQFLNRIPATVLPVLWGNAQTGILLITLVAASMIDLTDPSVQAGINGLVPGVLNAAQAAAILDH